MVCATAPAPGVPDDDWRPALHFAPPRRWINDPNGLVRVDGRWRLYFQYADDLPDYRHVRWGTATSADLLHWRFEGVALDAGAGLDAYSGSVLPLAPGRAGAPGLLAFYTENAARGPGPRRQAQRLALASESGARLEPAAGAPLLDEALADFRDPFVLRVDGELHLMLVAKPVAWTGAAAHERSRIAVYRSTDLREWRCVDELVAAESGLLWEVPWLLRLGTAGRPRWLLGVGTVDRRDGRTWSASRAWFVDLDGDARLRRTPDDAGFALDHGPDYYAAIPAATPLDRDDSGAALTIAWASNWRYARALPMRSWHGGPLSLPRRLGCAETAAGPRLRQWPVLPAGRELVAAHTRLERAETLGLGRFAGPLAVELEVEFDAPAADARAGDDAAGPAFELALGDGRLRLRHGVAPRWTLLRDAAPGDPPGFAGHWSADAEPDGAGVARALVVVDRCCVEIYCDDGAATFTALWFPPAAATALGLGAIGRGARVRLRVLALAGVAP